MKKKPTQAAFDNLVATFRDMDHADFLEGVRASLGYLGDHVAWQHEAETAIEPLEAMAWHGDERAFKSLLYLGRRIAQILENFSMLAAQKGTANDEEPYATLIPGHEKNTRSNNPLKKEDLDALESLSLDKMDTILKSLEKGFPELLTDFLPDYVLKISESRFNGSPVTFLDPESLPDHHFGELGHLTGILAAIRAKAECTQMVRQAIAQAESWPMNLPSVRELRASQLKKFEALQIGSELPVAVNPPQGRGKALGLTEDGATAFASWVHRELELERNYPRSLPHLESIRKSYAEYKKQAPHKDIKASAGIKLILAPEAQPWNRFNEWKAEAALLKPLSNNKIMLDLWTEAGMKFMYSRTAGFTQIKSLPESLQKKATTSTSQPSTQKIETVIRNSLKKGLKALASRIVVTPNGGNDIAQ